MLNLFLRTPYLLVLRVLLAAGVWCAMCATGYAQTTFDFTGPPVLITGNDLQQGAIYRYSGVAPGTDALVEVSALNMATLVQLDDSIGVGRALQPEIDGDAIGSYVEFEITFVDAGSSVSTSISAVLSALDVDTALEFNTFYNVSDYTVEANSDVTVVVSAGQTIDVTGGGVEYTPTSESNTNVAVSFTVTQVPSLVYRAGVNGNALRKASLLFDSINFNGELFFNINDDPVINGESNSVNENTSLLVGAAEGLLANDTDIDIGIDSDVLTVESFTVGANTYGVNSSVSLLQGELTLFADGGYEFIPAANFSGAVPPVQYHVEDGNGGTGSADLSLTVNQSNSPPVLNSDTAVLDSLDSVTISVLDNDIDADGVLDPATLRWLADLTNYPNGSTLSADQKTLDIAGQGVWLIVGRNVQFTPLASTSGQVDTVSYEVADDDGAGAVAQIQLTDQLQSDAVALLIDEDQDDNGFIGASELSGRIDVSAALPLQAVVGDSITFAGLGVSTEVTLTSAHVQAGVVTASFATPVDGDLIQIRASLTDESGNQSAVSRDSAVLDVSASGAPQVTILSDGDNSGFISAQEYAAEFQVEVVLPGNAVVNDKLTIITGSTSEEFYLTPVDIANGIVATTLTDISDGTALSVVAQLTDEAGNLSASGSDSAMIDNTAPLTPTINNQVSNSSIPQLSGTVPVDDNYLLSVQVAGVLYASGDGQLARLGNGNWTLDIPASDALADGTYDVTVVVTDMAGNSSADVTVDELTVDLVLPEIMAVNIGPSSDSAPLLNGSSDQLDGTVIVVQTEDGNHVCTSTVAAMQWSCTVQRPLAVGTNTLEAIVTDQAGNSANAELAVVVVAATDSDADGIADDIEGSADADQDGIPNYLDIDSDNDTISDEEETLVDTDADGIRNFLDHDSDNDGVADIQEAHAVGVLINNRITHLDQSVAVGENGLADAFESGVDSGIGRLPEDTDDDGIADYLDRDSDNDGISDVVENGFDAMRSAGSTIVAPDYDNDGVVNYRDLDSDQDGIADIREIPATDNNADGVVDFFQDTDGDGLNDGLAGAATAGHGADLDGDGIANFLDRDSDADGKLDTIESGGIDADNDGVHDAFLDLNDNGIEDTIDVELTQGDDADSDLIDDLYDADYTGTLDSDADGITDEFDSDANGDGMADVLAGVFLELPDQNNNGLVDVYEAITPVTAALTTGVGELGQGCTLIDPTGTQSSRIDLLFLCLMILSILGIGRNKIARRMQFAVSNNKACNTGLKL